MKVARLLSEVARDPNSVITVGTFDGVHLAHREIIRDVVNRSKAKEGRSVVVTFEPHPKEVVASTRGPVRLLSTLDDRIALIGGMDVDVLLVLEFTYAFSRISPREFYRDYIVQGTGVDEVVVGYDHMFGRDRAAGIEELVRMGKEFDFSVFAVHPFAVGGETVSSTKIRAALEAGDVAKASLLLGRPYGFSGRVVRGDGRGKTIGFPTANIEPSARGKIIPARGVYAVKVRIGATEYAGMMNIGVRPTVSAGGVETVEVHVLDFSRDLYGETVAVTFIKRLRDEQRFSSITELAAQLARDRDSARLAAGEMPV